MATVLSLRKNHFLKNREFAFVLILKFDSRSLILMSQRVTQTSRHKNQVLRDAFQESSRDCQLTFEQYCIYDPEFFQVSLKRFTSV